MSDWLDQFDPDERQRWEEFVEHARRDALQKIDESALVMQLVPEEPDVKIAVELGFSIMLDKPILAVVMPGRKVPRKLALVADAIVEADIDVEAGREKVAAAMREILGEEES